jgi:putative ABC transport system permease protein
LLGLVIAKTVALKLGWPLLVEMPTVFLAVAFSALVGIFFGFYPASRASKLDPIIALRSPV